MYTCLLAGALLLGMPSQSIGQNTTPEEPNPAETTEREQECGGYAPMAFFHVVTNVEGLRLRQGPSKDASVLASLPKNTRLIWHGSQSDEVVETTFDNGIPRKGRWVHVTVWKGSRLSGWVFSGALTLSHMQFDAEFGGSMECLNSSFVHIKSIDSLEFARQYAQSGSKLEKLGNTPLQSPDGQYSLRQLNARQDKMAGLEFSFQQAGRNTGKITFEMVYGNYLRRIAWAKASNTILFEWADEEMGKMYYEMGVPELMPDIP